MISHRSGAVRDCLWPVLAAPALVLAIPALDAEFRMAQPRPGNPDSEMVGVVGILIALVVGLIAPCRAAELKPHGSLDGVVEDIFEWYLEHPGDLERHF